MPVTIKSTGGGSVTMTAASTASDYTLTLPASTGTVATTADVVSFPSGTAMLFAQTSAPTGWTKSTTHNDKALRVVSGAASSGGSVAFSTAFSNQNVGATTLSTSQIPAHTHSLAMSNTDTSDGSSPNKTIAGSSTSGSTGGGGSHTHSLNIAVQYVDVIIATKD